MPTPLGGQTGITFEDLKTLAWAIGVFVSSLLAGVSVSWWFNQQLSSTRRDLYMKVDTVKREITASQKEVAQKIITNKDDCRDTKERVTLLERDHTHQQEKTAKMDELLNSIQVDLSTTKASVIELTQKSREGNLTIMGEIRSAEGRNQIAMLEMKELLVNVINKGNKDA